MPEIDERAVEWFPPGPKALAFLDSEAFICGIKGPIGCVAPDTLIQTESGLVRICDLKPGVRVLSWNETSNQFQLSPSAGGFPKGKDCLYRISMPQGEFRAAGHHRVFCADRKYRRVDQLKAGQLILGFSTVQVQKQNASCQKLSPEGERNYLQTISGYLDDCAGLIHRYGQRLRAALDNGLSSSPVPGDAQVSLRIFESPAFSHEDGQGEPSLKRNNRDQSFFRQRRMDFFRRLEDRLDGLEVSGGKSPSWSQNGWSQVCRQFPVWFVSRCKAAAILLRQFLFSSFVHSVSNGTILSIKRENFISEYWDTQVLDTHNYVTSDGSIHHNSGKSVTSVMKILDHAQRQPLTKDKVRRSRYAIIRNCYDDQTEILTEHRGWQYFKDLLDTDRVATLVDGAISYQRPDRVHAAPYHGEMLGFESEGVDFLVTPDHRMYVSKKRTRAQVWGAFEEKKVQDIYGSTKYRVKRNANWIGEDPGYSVDFFEWLGFWFAEGHVGKTDTRRRLNITQCKPHMLDYVEDLFERACIPYTKNSKQEGGFCYRVALGRANTPTFGDTVYELLKDCGLSPTKTLPLWIKSATAAQLACFIDGYAAGDGHTRYEGTVTLYTSSKLLADDLQEIALKAGQVANISVRDRIGEETQVNGSSVTTRHLQYIVTLLGSKKNSPVLHVYDRHTNHLRGWYKQDYDGIVYCVEMPLVPVYVRRNGKAFWCYRTQPELKTTTIPTWHQWMPKTRGRWVNQGPPTHHIIEKDAKTGITLDMEVWFVALDTPDDVAKVLSMELTSAWINEAREIPKAILDGLTGRVGRFKPDPAAEPDLWCWNGQIIMDTNPSEEDHWWYTLAEKDDSTEEGRQVLESLAGAEEELRAMGVLRQGQPLFEFFAQPGAYDPGAENLRNLPPGYYAKARAGKAQDYINVYINANYGFVKEGKPVYPEYKDSLHCQIFPLIRGLPIRFGLDFGFWPAAIFAQKTASGQWRIHSELCCEGVGTYRFAELIHMHLAEHYPGMKVVQITGDPAGDSRSTNDKQERTTFQIIRSLGINASAASSNDPVKRNAAVVGPLTRLVEGDPGIVIHPRCKILRKGLAGGYAYKKLRVSGTDRFQDKPDKNKYSHPVDALQYLMLGGGEFKTVVNKAKTDQPRRITRFRVTDPGMGF